MKVGGEMPVVEAADGRSADAQVVMLARFMTAGVNGLVVMAEAGASRTNQASVAHEITENVTRRLADRAA